MVPLLPPVRTARRRPDTLRTDTTPPGLPVLLRPDTDGLDTPRGGHSGAAGSDSSSPPKAGGENFNEARSPLRKRKVKLDGSKEEEGGDDDAGGTNQPPAGYPVPGAMPGYAGPPGSYYPPPPPPHGFPQGPPGAPPPQGYPPYPMYAPFPPHAQQQQQQQPWGAGPGPGPGPGPAGTPPNARSAKKAKTSPGGTLAVTDERKSRKNAQSRVRAARTRDQISEIQKKPRDSLTDDELKLLSLYEERRQRKNHRSKERAAEQKAEVERIQAVPDHLRSDKERDYLERTLSRRGRKNEGDRIRRELIKSMGVDSKTQKISVSVRGRRPRLAGSDVQVLPTPAAYHHQMPGGPGHQQLSPPQVSPGAEDMPPLPDGAPGTASV